MSLSSRSIQSARWNVAASGLQIIIGIIRFVVLSWWLPIEVFGWYAFGTAVVGISILVTEWGMNEAYLHRAEETENETDAIGVLFTLRMLFTVGWAVLLIAFALIFLTGVQQLTIIVLTCAHAINHPLMQTPTAILTRRVVHRRLALRQFLSMAATTVVSLYLAWQGAGLWALLATDIINAIVTVLVLYTWKPVWVPRFAWEPRIVRYYLNFGGRSFLGTLMLRTMDEIDDLWTNQNLGVDALGFYSRAYQLATYPRQLLAVPLSVVADGAYSELKGNRTALSQAFFRTNALIIRSGFLLAGILALTAHEFVPLLLTEKWVAMIPTFQLMLVFTMLDPLRSTVANLFIAVGRPEEIVRARVLQLVTLVVGLVLFGTWWGIEGVAIAVNVMLLVGIGTLLWKAHQEVDFSAIKLFRVPLLGLLLGIAGAYGILQLAGGGAWWWTGGIKFVAFGIIYSAVLLAFEYRDMVKMSRFILKRTSSL